MVNRRHNPVPAILGATRRFSESDLQTHQVRGGESLLVHCGLANWRRAAGRELRSTVSGPLQAMPMHDHVNPHVQMSAD